MARSAGCGERVRAGTVEAAMSATVILSPQAAAAEVCHDEQMEIWSHEIVVGLGMAGLLKDPLDSSELAEAHSVVKDELRSIIEMAFDHPEARTIKRR